MKKKTKVCMGAILFTTSALLSVTGLVAITTYKLSTIGLIGVCAISVGVFGLYYGALLLGKD